jgi:hypothetical protein
MADTVITSLEQVTAGWLTSVLTHSGALKQGTVEAFEPIDTYERELSTNTRLNVRYTAGSQGDRPTRLFLKLVNIDQGDEFFGPSEVNYYSRDYVGLAGAPIVHSYSAAYSAELGRYHLLMDDLSATHIEARHKTPTLDYGLALAAALAKLHAHWWGAERLAAGGEPIPSAEVIKRFVAIARPGVSHILAGYADQLEPHWPDTLHDLFEHHPRRLVARTQHGNGFTLIHGDVNPGNVFVPVEGNRPLYIVDRQPFDWSLTTWLGVYDLSYAIVHRWPVETRRQYEQQILEHYHAELIANGVRGYSWKQLFEDYRLCAVISVYVATEWCRGGVNEQWVHIWLPMLQKAMTAFDDLDCAQLWQKQVLQRRSDGSEPL